MSIIKLPVMSKTSADCASNRMNPNLVDDSQMLSGVFYEEEDPLMTSSGISRLRGAHSLETS